LEAMSFIDGLNLFLELIAILVITFKIEQKKINKKILMRGLLLAILLFFFSYFIRHTISRFFPLIGTSSVLLFYTLFIFILFNRFYRNNFIRSFLKTGITFLIIFICQLTLQPFSPIVSSVLGYELMIDIISFFAQLWIITFMLFIYPRFRNRVNQMVLKFSDHPNYVLGSFFYMIVFVVAGTYINTYLIDNVFPLIMMFLISSVIFVGLFYMIYKHLLS
jgi:hypothetical protein